MNYQPKLTYEQRRQRAAEIVAAARNGATVQSLAETHGLTIQHVYELCRDGDAKVRGTQAENRQKYESADWTKRNAELAVVFGLTESAVESIRKRLGKPKQPHKLREWKIDERYLSADWTLQDVELASILHVCRERVRQVRKKLGKPKAANHHFPTKEHPGRRWILDHRDMLGTMTDREVADACPFPASSSFVQQIRREIGVAPKPRFKITTENLDSLIVKVPCDGFADPCWNIATPSNAGCPKYPVAQIVDGKRLYAHRFVWEMLGNPPPPFNLLRMCKNPDCVNPAHMKPGDGSKRKSLTPRRARG